MVWFFPFPSRLVPSRRVGWSDGTGRTRKKGDLEMDGEAKEKDSELLANIKRLTVRVLDNLDQGTERRTLDEQQKRLLSSTGARLLRLWRTVEREGRSRRTDELTDRISRLMPEKTETGGVTV